MFLNFNFTIRNINVFYTDGLLKQVQWVIQKFVVTVHLNLKQTASSFDIYIRIIDTPQYQHVI